MKILITGGCGFLGSNLAEASSLRGHDTLIFDNLSRKGAVENLSMLQTLPNINHMHGDIRSTSDIAMVVKEFIPDAVFHLAGQVAMTTSISNPRKDFEINALGSLNLLEAIKIYAPDARVIYSSTNKVYGDLQGVTYTENDSRYLTPNQPKGLDETLPLNFHSPYGCSKGAAEQYMLDYHRIFGLKTTVFRHSSMYGARQYATFDQGWVSWFCLQAAETERSPQRAPFTISGNGKQVRDVLHADDLVNLYFAALQQPGDCFGRAFNIGGGIDNSLSLLELFSMLEEFIAMPLNYTHLPARISDQLVFVADTTAASEIFSWQPTVTARDGIRSMLDWTRKLIS